jgi:pimeloyl-ACP methyl ester carboxylesterase
MSRDSRLVSAHLWCASILINRFTKDGERLMDSSVSQFSTQVQTEAQQALEDFLTPAKKPLSDSEQAILEQATVSSIPFGAIDIPTFCWGSGATVLLIHGWGGYGLQLSQFVEPLLQAGFRILAFDAPAHGRTAGVQTSGLEMAQVIATVAHHQPAIAGVIAHSLGATSTTLALSEGMRAARVVYIGAICWLSNAAVTFAKRARLSTEVEVAFRALFEARFGRDIWQRFAVEQTAKHLSIPTLLFHDCSDREVSIEESQAIAQVWSGSRLIETSGLGHRRILRNASVIQQAVAFMTNSLI